MAPCFLHACRKPSRGGPAGRRGDEVHQEFRGGSMCCETRTLSSGVPALLLPCVTGHVANDRPQSPGFRFLHHLRASRVWHQPPGSPLHSGPASKTARKHPKKIFTRNRENPLETHPKSEKMAFAGRKMTPALQFLTFSGQFSAERVNFDQGRQLARNSSALKSAW